MKTHLEQWPPQPTHTEDELDGFFANTLGMLCVAGFDGYFKRLNPAWTTTLGWSLEELQSRPFMEFVHPGDRAATCAEMENLTGGGRTILFENRYRCRDDSYKWLQWNANNHSARGQVYAIARDISASRGLEREILETSDREKERMGRELHDGLCQNLAGIAALSTTLSRKLAADSNLAAGDAREITKLLNETIGHARDMARGLNPVNLEHIGIAAALEALAANVEALFQVSCEFRCRCPDLEFGSGVEAHLYRIAQEAVNNAITHGRARRIMINLGVRDGHGLLGIRDDGVGLPAKPAALRGVGVHTMDYRSHLIGGTLQVRPRSRRGTAVTCSFPLPSGHPED